MDIIIKPRCEGKTTELIRRSYETNTYIITPDRKRADYIFKMAKEMQYNILHPIAAIDFPRHTLIKSVLIDDADDLLRWIFNNTTIDAITMTQNSEV